MTKDTFFIHWQWPGWGMFKTFNLFFYLWHELLSSHTSTRGVTHIFWMFYRIFSFKKPKQASDVCKLIIIIYNAILKNPLDLFVCAVRANQMQCCGWTSRQDWSGNMVIVNSSGLLFPCSCQNVSATSGNFSDSGFCEAQTPDWPVYDVVSGCVSLCLFNQILLQALESYSKQSSVLLHGDTCVLPTLREGTIYCVNMLPAVQDTWV